MVDKALDYSKETQKDRVKKLRSIITIACSALFALGILVCVICDLAISGSFTWSLFPVSSIIFAWFVSMPAIKWGERGIVGSMAALSVLLLPFLWILNGLTGNQRVFMPIAVSTSILSLAYLWCVFAAFKKWRGKKLLAAAVACLLSVPLCILINICVSRVLGEALIDGWDILSAAILGLIALILFRVHFRKEQSARPSDRVG